MRVNDWYVPVTLLYALLFFPGLYTILNQTVDPFNDTSIWGYLWMPFVGLAGVYIWIGVFTGRIIADIRNKKAERITRSAYDIFLTYLDGIFCTLIALSCSMSALHLGVIAGGNQIIPPFTDLPPNMRGFDLIVACISDTMGWYFTAGSDTVTIGSWLGNLYKIVTLGTGVASMGIILGVFGVIITSHVNNILSEKVNSSIARALTTRRIVKALDVPKGYKHVRSQRRTAHSNIISGRTAQ